MNRRIRNIIGDFYLVIMLLFLYLPIFTMIVLSFNESKSRTRWGGFTLRWYGELFSNATIMQALHNTLLIAFLSALIATVLGTAAAIGINAMKPTGRNLMIGLNNIPMLDADIVTGISLMLARTLCPACSPVFCSLSRCRSMILSSPTSPKERALTPCPR